MELQATEFGIVPKNKSHNIIPASAAFQKDQVCNSVFLKNRSWAMYKIKLKLHFIIFNLT